MMNRNRWLILIAVTVLVVTLAAGSALAFGFGERKMQSLDLTEDQHQLLASIREHYEGLMQPLHEQLREAREALDWEQFGTVSAALAQLRHGMTEEMREILPAGQPAHGDCGCEQGCEVCRQAQRSHRWTRFTTRRGT